MTRDPASVRCLYVNHASLLPHLGEALRSAERVAIDTEVPIDGPQQGLMRVMSVACRAQDGSEQAFVIDSRDVDPTLLSPLLDGVTADAWNANFDARVVDAAVWQSKDTTPGLTWWDAQLADALIHQGRSGVSWYHGLAWATHHYLGLKAQGKGTVQLSYTAFDDLTEEQIRYAAADAVETLWVADAIRSQVSDAGLDQITEIEMAARPFLDQMERTGLPFDWDGWQAELADIEVRNRGVVGQLSELTGGGQGNLFDEVIEPSWNPASDRQVREALNKWAPSEVHAWTAVQYGQARSLSDTDRVTAMVLREIGGELCETILEFRNHTKILSTYGESIREHLDEDGRMRPQYLQVVGTNTGRLASRNPNAQNFTPRMLPYVRPADPDRVFVHADLSQAELRFLAQVAQDVPLRKAFAAGVDVHVSTAASMFGFEPSALRTEDPDRYAHLRKIAKALNFGIAYGTGAAALSRSLSAEGSTTSVEEASRLLAQYRQTYPGTATWAEARIAEIKDLREETARIDWRASMRLARGFGEVASLRRDFRRKQNRWPDAEEIAVLHSRRDEGDRAQLVDHVNWLLGYSAPVALVDGGEPFTFSSRTVAGRRQQFNLHLERLFLVAVFEAVRSTEPALVALRQDFEHDHGLVLHGRLGEGLTDGELEHQFENRALRREYIEGIAAALGKEAADGFLQRAARERVSAMVNAWRNAPIQGGVADIMLVAYADLHVRLRRYPTARPVQTVHDSVVVECDHVDATQMAKEVREALEQASQRFCPDVAPRADVDIRTTLADDDALAV